MMQFSVLMSVYKEDNPDFLQEALVSIWDAQTLKPNQIVIVQDGPITPKLHAILQTWQQTLPEVITVMSLEKNEGLGRALNAGLKLCRYDLIARMDSDDISLPQRFASQIHFMQANPQVSVSSAYLEEIDELGRIHFVRQLPLVHAEILRFAKLRSPINHPVAIFRKSAVLSVDGYPPFAKAQDYGLWCLLLKNGFQFANLDHVLLKMRCGANMLKRRGLAHLKNDLRVLRLQRKIRFISRFEFVKNLLLRSFLRLAPFSLKKLLYNYKRNL